MNKEFGTIRNILLRLHTKQDSKWRSILPKATKDSYESLIRTKTKMNNRQIESLLSDRSNKPKANFGESLSYFYLPPLKDNPEYVPLLTLRCDFNDTHNNISLQVHLYCHDSDQETKGLGFRFEGSHGGDNHDYYHLQPIKELHACKNREITGCPPWMLDKVPTIPLSEIKNPVTLLLFLLASFYGKEAYKEFFGDMDIDPEYLGQIKEIFLRPE